MSCLSEKASYIVNVLIIIIKLKIFATFYILPKLPTAPLFNPIPHPLGHMIYNERAHLVGIGLIQMRQARPPLFFIKISEKVEIS